jgi:phosphatidylserine/phosphatidylglycerophosphate/cardiolipin synthase-like enzyme
MLLRHTLGLLLALAAALPAAASPSMRPAPVEAEALLTGRDDACAELAVPLKDRVLALVRSAERSIWLAAYTLSDKDLIAALEERAANPELDVRIICDAEQHQRLLDRLDEDDPRLEQLETLTREGRLAPLEVGRGEGRLHTKLLLVDDTTLVLGSKNWSDLKGHAKWNDAVVLRDTHGKTARAAKQALWRLFTGTALAKRDPRASNRAQGRRGDDANAVDAALGTTEPALAQLWFCAPGREGQEARQQLLRLVKGARERVHVAMFVLTDRRLVQALITARRRGVDVRVVVDGTQHANLEHRKDDKARQLRRELAMLKDADVLRPSGSGRQLHHKLAIIDGTAITGSANWSEAAWTQNHEVLLVLRSPDRDTGLATVKALAHRHSLLWEAAAKP